MATVLPMSAHDVPVTKYDFSKSRFCTACEMTPALLALVASVVALAVALYMHSYYLCIPFGLGILGSSYALYTAYRIRDLTSLSNSAYVLEQEVSRLQASNTRLEKTAADLSEQNAQLRQTNEELRKNVDSLRSSVDDFEKQCTTLRDQLSDLEKLKTTMASDLQIARKDRDLHSQDLQQARLQLQQIEDEFKETIRTFNLSLSSLKSLTDTTAKLGKTTDSNVVLEASLRQTLTECSTLARRLSGPTLEEILAIQVILKKNLEEQQALLKQTQLAHTTLNAEIPILAKERERIAAETARLAETSQSLHNEVGRLQGQIDLLQRQLSKITDVNNS